MFDKCKNLWVYKNTWMKEDSIFNGLMHKTFKHECLKARHMISIHGHNILYILYIWKAVMKKPNPSTPKKTQTKQKTN